MANSSKSFFSFAFLSLSLLLLFLFLSHNLPYDYCSWRVGRRLCVSDRPPVRETSRSRKMLEEMKNKIKEEIDGGKGRRTAAEWDQLRRVPSGPDPLHHSGGSPKKPKTP